MIINYDIFHSGLVSFISILNDSGFLHNEYGPAEIGYSYNKGIPIVSSEKWFISGDLHRIGGPAAIYYNFYGAGVEAERYYINGLKHNELGPAETRYQIIVGDRVMIKSHYYLNNLMLTKEEWEDQLATKLYW